MAALRKTEQPAAKSAEVNLSTASTACIRAAMTSDAEAIAALSTQLGYPATPEQIERRLLGLLDNADHAVFVAEAAERVVGWAHVALWQGVSADAHAELVALVVDSARRGLGVGGLLLCQAESWARARNLPALSVRSNIIREHAHRFYLERGYHLVKTQHAFEKTL